TIPPTVDHRRRSVPAARTRRAPHSLRTSVAPARRGDFVGPYVWLRGSGFKSSDCARITWRENAQSLRNSFLTALNPAHPAEAGLYLILPHRALTDRLVL